MIDNLKRIREPLAWALIALVVADLVLGIVQLVEQLRETAAVFAAFEAIGTGLMNISLVIATVAVVCTCFFIAPSTRHALLVTRVAAWVLTVGVLLTAICNILGVAAADNPFGVVVEIIGGVLDLALKAVAAATLWLLMRGVSAGRIDTAPAAVPEPLPEAAPGTAAVPAEPRTTWGRDEAAGAVWLTADEAASGLPGASRIPADLADGVFGERGAEPRAEQLERRPRQDG